MTYAKSLWIKPSNFWANFWAKLYANLIWYKSISSSAEWYCNTSYGELTLQRHRSAPGTSIQRRSPFGDNVHFSHGGSSFLHASTNRRRDTRAARAGGKTCQDLTACSFIICASGSTAAKAFSSPSPSLHLVLIHPCPPKVKTRRLPTCESLNTVAHIRNRLQDLRDYDFFKFCMCIYFYSTVNCTNVYPLFKNTGRGWT